MQPNVHYCLTVLFTGIVLAAANSVLAHTGLVDGYGCHRGKDKTSYHCHEGPYAGRTFKSKEEFLRQLRSGKSEQLAPKNNQPRVEKRYPESDSPTTR